MHLSKRLEEVASMVQNGNRVADVGTDHGYIPIFLVKEQKVPSAIAMDVRKGPLERAILHIKEYHVEDKIQARLSDGLEKLNAGEADTVVIAGMGGELMIRILQQGKHMWETVSQWVLSPQSELDEVRHFLTSSGFVIARESMLEEDGKFYVVMDVRPNGQYAADETIPEAVRERYGVYLLQEKNKILYQFLIHERQVKRRILDGMKDQMSESSIKRRMELEQELEWNRMALQLFET